MQNIKAKIVVIGGGPAGANAAKYLALAGEDVLLIQKSPNFDKPCGGGLFIKAFDEFNIPKKLIKHKVDRIDIVSSQSKVVPVDISSYPLAIVHRQEFDASLRELAKDAGAKVLYAKVVSVTTTKDGIKVVAKNSDNQQIEIEANYAIAADGVNSITKKELLGQTPSRILTNYANIDGKNSKSCQFWFGDDIAPKHYAWIFPHHNGINIGLVTHNKGKIKEFFNTFTKKINLNSTPKIKGYFIPYWEPTTLYKDRVFYVGDSASLVLPFTYEGIYYALKSGKLAADAIIKNNPKYYEEEWNRLYLKKFKFLRTLQTIFLRNSWWSNQMVKLYQNPKFQKSVIAYWSGTKEPEGVLKTIFKVTKRVVFR